MSRSRRLAVRALLWFLGTLLVALFLAWFAVGIIRWRAASDRIRWGKEAIAELTITPAEALKAKGTTNSLGRDWITDTALYTADGQLLAFKSRHGRSFVGDHLFLAHSSDDRWFYSSYHFCNGMNMIRGDDAPLSIEEFCSRYAVREFTLGSNIWSQTTWTP